MKLSLRAKLTGLILALAVLITAAVTVGSYVQMRGQLIDTGIRNEVSATATGTSALIKEWIATRKSIVAAGVHTAQTADDPLPAIVQVAKSGKFEAAYLGTPDEMLIAGTVGEVGERIARERAEARTRHGWIMDTYLLRAESTA